MKNKLHLLTLSFLALGLAAFVLHIAIIDKSFVTAQSLQSSTSPQAFNPSMCQANEVACNGGSDATTFQFRNCPDTFCAPNTYIGGCSQKAQELGCYSPGSGDSNECEVYVRYYCPNQYDLIARGIGCEQINQGEWPSHPGFDENSPGTQQVDCRTKSGASRHVESRVIFPPVIAPPPVAPPPPPEQPPVTPPPVAPPPEAPPEQPPIEESLVCRYLTPDINIPIVLDKKQGETINLTTTAESSFPEVTYTYTTKVGIISGSGFNVTWIITPEDLTSLDIGILTNAVSVIVSGRDIESGGVDTPCALNVEITDSDEVTAEDDSGNTGDTGEEDDENNESESITEEEDTDDKGSTGSSSDNDNDNDNETIAQVGNNNTGTLTTGGDILGASAMLSDTGTDVRVFIAGSVLAVTAAAFVLYFTNKKKESMN